MKIISPTLTSLNVLGVLGVLNVLHVLHVLYVLHVLNMLMDASLACWALFSICFSYFYLMVGPYRYRLRATHSVYTAVFNVLARLLLVNLFQMARFYSSRKTY